MTILQNHGESQAVVNSYNTHLSCDAAVEQLESIHKVLIVEEDAQLRANLAGALSGEYLVRSASTCLEALDILQQDAVDLVLLNILMRDGNGFAVLGHTAGMYPKPHVIIISGAVQPMKAAKAIRLGADECVMTPGDLNVIRRAVREVLVDKAH